MADRLPRDQLHLMMNDENDGVLRMVVEEIDPRYLFEIAKKCSGHILSQIVNRFNDSNWDVKGSVLLKNIVNNENFWDEQEHGANHLRSYLINRIHRDELLYFINDPYENNRWRVASLISAKYMPQMYENEKNTFNDKNVIKILEERMEELGMID